MSAPTVDNTWVFTEINQTHSAGSATALAPIIMYDLKASLVTLGWDIAGSSDGTTADTNDNWASSSDCNWAASGAHSWIVYKNTNLDLEICFDLSSFTVSFCDIVFSRAGFTGFTSTSARPTATDEHVAINDGFWGHNDQVTQAALHVIATDDGAGGPLRTYAFFVQQDSGTESQCMLISKVDTPFATGNPVYYMLSAGWTGEEPTVSKMYSTTSNQRVWYGSATHGDVRCTASVSGPSFARIVSNSGGVPSDLDNGYPLDPIGVYSESSPGRGKFGYLADAWWGYPDHVTGDVYPSTSNDFAKFGAIVVPWGDNTAPDLGA